MIYQLIYTSQVAPGVHASDLMQISECASSENAVQDITGMLLVSDDRVIQILEGTKMQVEALFAHIRKDDRHQDVNILASAEADTREFSGQAMAMKFIQSDHSQEAFDALLSQVKTPKDIAA